MNEVKYESSGILVVFLSKRSAVKVQLKFARARRPHSDKYFNITTIILRPTTVNGAEIKLGGENGPNP